MATFDINDVARRVQYTSTGQTGPFSFTFQVNASSELLVYIDDTEKTETTHYTVSLNADGTGSVTFTTATTSGELITIIGDQPLSRTTVFQVGQVNQPTTLETEFDNTLIRQQQIKEITDRSIQLKPSTGRTVTGSGTSGPLYFPYDTTVANNASRVVAYDSAGTSLELGPTTANLNTLATITSDISTVAGISSDVTTVAGIASDVTSVASDASNINTVATNIANVNTVAGISSNVTTVAGISSDVSTVSGISANTTTVAGISGNVTTVAGISSDVSTVAGISANVTTVATNIADVNNFAEVYRISASAPTTSLDVGDLYFDTTDDVLKVYSSSGWQNAGSSVNGTSARFQYSVSSSTTTITGTDDNGNSLLYDAGYVDVYLNGIKMVNGSDVTVTSGSSVVFATAIGTSGTDTVDIIAYGTFNVAAIDATSITSGTLGFARGGTGLSALGSADEVLQVNAGGTALEYGKVDTANIADDAVGATQLDVSGNGTSGQVLASDGDGTFSWADAPSAFSYNAVSGTTPSLDLGSYNFFNQGALTGNTTVSFASVPTEHKWNYTFRTAGTSGAFDISTTVKTADKIELRELGTNFYEHTFGDSGTKLYAITYDSSSYARVYQYNLSSAYQVSTAVDSGNTFELYGTENYPRGITFKTDGTKMYIVGTYTDTIHTYNLSTAWDLSTASSASETFDVGSSSASMSNLSSIDFKSDGTTFWCTDYGTNDVAEFSCSTAWNVSTASYVREKSLPQYGITDPVFSRWNSDGSKLYIGDYSVDGFVELNASTAYRIDTLSLSESISFSSGNAYNVYSFDISSDGQYFFVGGLGERTIVKYKAESMYSLTLPSSVQNHPQPLMPDSTVNYEFFTADGGTNVYLINETQTMTK